MVELPIALRLASSWARWDVGWREHVVLFCSVSCSNSVVRYNSFPSTIKHDVKIQPLVVVYREW